MNIAIVEDSEIYANQLTEYIQRYADEKNLGLETKWFGDSLKFTENYKGGFDILFFDVKMPVMDGITAAGRIRQIDDSVVILFLTNMAQYAIKGYEVDALDYLLKPLSYKVFYMKFTKAVRSVMARPQKTITISGNGMVRRIRALDIYYIEVMNHQLCFHTKHGDFTQTGATSLGDMERELVQEGFSRCSQSYLVNLKYVDCMQQDSVWVSGRELKASRNKKKEFAKALVAWHRETM